MSTDYELSAETEQFIVSTAKKLGFKVIDIDVVVEDYYTDFTLDLAYLDYEISMEFSEQDSSWEGKVTIWKKGDGSATYYKNVKMRREASMGGEDVVYVVLKAIKGSERVMIDPKRIVL